jgi:hypothetical protein
MTQPDSKRKEAAASRRPRWPHALATVALCVGIAGCGGAGGKPAAARSGPPARENDRDNDYDHNDDDSQTVHYGHAAGAADERSSVALVRRYFAAAAAADGARACALLVPLVAESIAEEAVGSTVLHGKTCPTVASELFTREHRQLEQKRSALEVYAVRVNGNRGVILIEFPTIGRELRQIAERRIHGAWRIAELYDTFVG